MVKNALWMLILLPWLVRMSHAESAESLGSMLHDEDFTSAVKAIEDFDHPKKARPTGSYAWELSFTPGYSKLLYSDYQGLSYSNGILAEGALFYQFGSFIQFGVNGGYSFNHDNKTEILTVDGYDFFYENTLEIHEVTPEIRIGSWIHNSRIKWRPYAQFGAGWYEIFQKYNEKITGSQFLYRYQISQTTNDFLGANGGVGVEFEIYSGGVVGLQIAYHRLFSSPSNLVYVAPGLELAYLF